MEVSNENIKCIFVRSFVGCRTKNVWQPFFNRIYSIENKTYSIELTVINKLFIIFLEKMYIELMEAEDQIDRSDQ